MAIVQSRASRWWNRAAIMLALVMLVVSMIPLYWIGSTAFKARSDATTVPPTVFFEPEITPFIKLFTARVQQRGERDEAAYTAAPWWERLVMDGGDRFIKDEYGRIESSGYVSRFVNSIVIAVTSTFLAVALGTITAYGFSRFKMPGEDDWLFFILSTRMLPPVVVAIPMFLMYRAVGLVDTHVTLIGKNLDAGVQAMLTFRDIDDRSLVVNCAFVERHSWNTSICMTSPSVRPFHAHPLSSALATGCPDSLIFTERIWPGFQLCRVQ